MAAGAVDARPNDNEKMFLQNISINMILGGIEMQPLLTDSENFIKNEFKNVKLGDKRLERRMLNRCLRPELFPGAVSAPDE